MARCPSIVDVRMMPPLWEMTAWMFARAASADVLFPEVDTLARFDRKDNRQGLSRRRQFRLTKTAPGYKQKKEHRIVPAMELGPRFSKAECPARDPGPWQGACAVRNVNGFVPANDFASVRK